MQQNLCELVSKPATIVIFFNSDFRSTYFSTKLAVGRIFHLKCYLNFGDDDLSSLIPYIIRTSIFIVVIWFIREIFIVFVVFKITFRSLYTSAFPGCHCSECACAFPPIHITSGASACEIVELSRHDSIVISVAFTGIHRSLFF